MKYLFIKRALPLSLLLFGLHSEVVWSQTTTPVTGTLPADGCSLKLLKGTYSWDENTTTDYSSQGYTAHTGLVYAVSVGREVNDGKGNITNGQFAVNNTFNGVEKFTYTGTVTVDSNCIGQYHITLSTGDSGGGGTIYVNPKTGDFTLLDEFNIGIAHFIKDAAPGGDNQHKDRDQDRW